MSIDTTVAGSGVDEQVPLSFNQEFLCMFDQGDGTGPFGPRHNIVNAWRLTGPVDVETLHVAVNDLVERHEALRTVVVRGDVRYQKVLPPSPVGLLVLDLSEVPADGRDLRVEELLIEYELGEYSVDEMPLLRAVLGRFDRDDAVLLLIAHHTAVDEWSMKLLIRDLSVRYAVRRGFEVPPLPAAKQYREYAAWQLAHTASPAADKSRAYWRDKCGGAQILALHTDHARSEGLPKGTSVYRFLIGRELTAAALELAKVTRSSPFMVLLAAYKVLLAELTGVTDVVVPTLASGRNQARFQDTVGLFFNFVPFRTDLAGCGTFREVVERTRQTCIQAYSRDLPFAHVLGEAPTLATPFGDDNLAVVAFQVFQFPFLLDHERVGDIEYSDVRRRLLSQPDSTDIPDGALWQLDIDPSGDMIGYLGYNSNLFEEATMSQMVTKFCQVLRYTVAAPDQPLSLPNQPVSGP